MKEDFSVEVAIPSDEDGFILLKCGYCGNFFKIPAHELNNEDIFNIYCPCCGLVSESYITQDVVDLARAMITNYMNEVIYDAFKGLEKTTKKGPVQFKTGKRPKHEYEMSIKTGIEALEIATFNCCSKKAKVKPLLKMTGCYCPFCGVKEYDVK